MLGLGKKTITGSLSEATDRPIYTPPSVIAGVLPAPSSIDRPEEPAYHAACHALDSEQVHLIVTKDQGRIWYLAALSRDFASHPYAATPLAMALPGHDSYRGDGIYRATSDGRMAVIVKREDSFDLYPDIPADAGDLPIFDCDAAEPMAWSPYALREQAFIREQTNRMIKVGLSMCVAGFAFWITVTSVDAAVNRTVIEREKATVEAVIEASRDIDTRQPILAQLHRMTRISDAVVRAGGVLRVYRFDPESETEWMALMPTWVTSDYLNGMGRVTAKRTPNPSAILVHPVGMEITENDLNPRAKEKVQTRVVDMTDPEPSFVNREIAPRRGLVDIVRDNR